MSFNYLIVVNWSFRLCLRVWRGGEEKALRDGKYEGKWRNISKNLE